MNTAIKILIIEDEEVILDVLSMKLKKIGYEVLSAKNGEEGIKVFKETKPDLVLLDIIMPKQDGFDVLKAAQEDPEINSIPIIIISNSGQPVEIDKALQLGATDYIIKAQFEPDEVIKKVSQALLAVKAEKSNLTNTTAPTVKSTQRIEKKIMSKHTNKISILIIEDDQFLRELITKKLRIEGFTVSEAQDGEEGYKKIIEVKPNLVLLDIILPLTNGFELLEKVRAEKDKNISQIPIIMLSNLGQDSDIQRGKTLGANGYLVKASLTTDEIVQKLREFI